MNKLQKRLVLFLFILSLGVSLSAFKAVKVTVEKNGEIGRLSSKVTDFTNENQLLSDKCKDTEIELEKTKQELGAELNEERDKVASFKAKYEAEAEKTSELNASLDDLKQSLEEERKNFAAETEKLKEEKELLSRDLNETKLAKESLEAFVSEGKIESIPVKSVATAFTASGRIVTVYPQGFMGVELEKSPFDTISLGKIVKGDNEIGVSRIHGHIVILEVDRREDLSDIKKGDIVKYVK